jgi:ankyrin repeat protein
MEAELRRAIESRDHAALRRWLAQPGVDVNARLGGEETALHLAASEWDPTAVGILLAAGADPAARDRDGKTPAGRLEGVGDPSFMVQELMDVDECRRLLGLPR